jgi:hypothetical protein
VRFLVLKKKSSRFYPSLTISSTKFSHFYTFDKTLSQRKTMKVSNGEESKDLMNCVHCGNDTDINSKDGLCHDCAMQNLADDGPHYSIGKCHICGKDGVELEPIISIDSPSVLGCDECKENMFDNTI